MRNWHPLLPDTLREMYDAGFRNTIGFIAAAHHSYSSCQQYRENVGEARAALRQATGGDVNVTYVKSWFDHPLFIQANAEHVKEALWRLPLDLRISARLVFTAHSIPVPMADASQYEQQLLASAAEVADAGGLTWALVYQSRSGRPSDPWLEPDGGGDRRREKAARLDPEFRAPIRSVCEGLEVLYALGREAAEGCREIRLPMVRAAAGTDSPLFLDMIADVVLDTLGWYQDAKP